LFVWSRQVRLSTVYETTFSDLDSTDGQGAESADIER
jgi:hypothetical protein